jgi:hypothetical protein
MTERRTNMAKKTTSKSSNTSTKPTAKPEKAQPKKAAAGNGKPAPKKAPPEKQAAAPAPAAGAKPKTAAKATKAPRARDPRLPEPGTVLQKKDRQGTVRCECTVEQDGIRYQGTLYRSLSAAAMAASKDMGLGGRAQNGYLFWGIIRQPGREKDPVAALERAWERYESRAKGIMSAGLDENNKAKVLTTVRKHAAALEGLQAQVA